MNFGSILDLLFHVFPCLQHHFFEHVFHMDFSLILARLLHGSREGRPCFFANSPSIIVVLWKWAVQKNQVFRYISTSFLGWYLLEISWISMFFWHWFLHRLLIDFWTKMAPKMDPWATFWAQKSPKMDAPFRREASLDATLRPTTPQNHPKSHFYRFWTDFGPIFSDFWWIVEDLGQICALILA